MNRSAIRAPFVACLAIGAIVGATVSASAQMGGGAPPPSAPKAAPKPSSSSSGEPKVSASLAKPLLASQEALKANDFTNALAHAKEAQAVDGRTDYDNYVINQFLANIYIGMKDYKNAEAAAQAMSDSPALPAADKINDYSMVVQLAANSQDWAVATKYGAMLQTVQPVSGVVAEQLAISYYNTGQKDKALELAKAQIAADKAAGRQSNEAMLQIEMGGLAGQKDNAGAKAALENLVQQHGEPDNWGRLIELSFAGRLSDVQALNLYRLRVVTNATTSMDDFAIMGQVASSQSLYYPTEAEAMLEQGVSEGVVKPGDKASAVLAQVRPKAAKDKATLAELEKVAIQHKTGDYDAKLAETYYGYGRYADTEAAIRRAMGKGGVKDMAEAQMILGMSLARQNKNTEAADVFAKVGGNPSEQDVAHLWTLYVQRQYGATPAH